MSSPQTAPAEGRGRGASAARPSAGWPLPGWRGRVAERARHRCRKGTLFLWLKISTIGSSHKFHYGKYDFLAFQWVSILTLSGADIMP